MPESEVIFRLLVAFAVGVFDTCFFKSRNKFFDGRNTETDMRILRMFHRFGSAFYQVKVTVIPNRKPGMLPIMKRFGYRVEPDDVFIKCSAFAELGNVQGYVIQCSFLHGTMCLNNDACNGNGRYDSRKDDFFHKTNYKVLRCTLELH